MGCGSCSSRIRGAASAPAKLKKVRRILHRLDEAASIQDLRTPGWQLHELKGPRAGTWSIRVTRTWRITFRFEDGDVYDVNYEDYH